MATRQEIADLAKAIPPNDDWLDLFMYALHQQFPEVATEVVRQAKKLHNTSKVRPAVKRSQSDIAPVVLRCSNVAFYKERGDTYKTIAKKYNLSMSRIQQIVKKHNRMMHNTALSSVGLRKEFNWDKRAFGFESSNLEETNAIICLLKRMAKGTST